MFVRQLTHSLQGVYARPQGGPLNTALAGRSLHARGPKTESRE